MKKSARMESFIGGLGLVQTTSFDPCYLGYFECFNTQNYYEAHDVLEHLWLKDGRSAPDYAFYKGLIQLAGGFVHLKLQHANPTHPKHGKRLAPARRLFLLLHRFADRFVYLRQVELHRRAKLPTTGYGLHTVPWAGRVRSTK